MALSLDKALGVHESALYLRSKRTELLASNLANADTPNYKARDINFASALRAAESGKVAAPVNATNTRHLAVGDAVGGEGLMMYRTPSQASLDGNTVDTQVEQAEFARNALHYQASLMFIEKRLKGLLSAIKGE